MPKKIISSSASSQASSQSQICSRDPAINGSPNSVVDAITVFADREKKPKRNRSAFILFSIDIRRKLKSRVPDHINPNDIFVEIAKLWKEASQEEKKLYRDRAKQEKEIYMSKLREFCEKFPTEPIQRPRNRPKKPCNGYGLFFKEILENVRRENPGVRMCEVLKKVSIRWRDLPADDRYAYEKEAEENMKEFKTGTISQQSTLKKTNSIRKNRQAPLVQWENQIFMETYQKEEVLSEEDLLVKKRRLENKAAIFSQKKGNQELLDSEEESFEYQDSLYEIKAEGSYKEEDKTCSQNGFGDLESRGFLSGSNSVKCGASSGNALFQNMGSIFGFNDENMRSLAGGLPLSLNKPSNGVIFALKSLLEKVNGLKENIEAHLKIFEGGVHQE